MSVQAHEGVALSADDRARMTRLKEEVQGRLQEMALIGSRTLGVTLDPDAVPVFDPTHNRENFRRSADEGDGPIIVVIGPKGAVCYIDPPGICIAC